MTTLAVIKRKELVIHFRVDFECVCSLADVVDGPERSETRRERSPHKVIITVSIAGVLLCGIVSAGVSWVIRRILFLAINIESELNLLNDKFH